MLASLPHSPLWLFAWGRDTSAALALVLACQIADLAFADCVPSPIAAKISNVTLSNNHTARGMAISVGLPSQDLAFLPQT